MCFRGVVLHQFRAEFSKFEHVNGALLDTNQWVKGWQMETFHHGMGLAKKKNYFHQIILYLNLLTLNVNDMSTIDFFKIQSEVNNNLVSVKLHMNPKDETMKEVAPIKSGLKWSPRRWAAL